MISKQTEGCIEVPNSSMKVSVEKNWTSIKIIN